MKIGKTQIKKRILPISLCLLAVIYLFYHIANGLRTDAQFYSVRPYTADDSQVFTGYIFKNEPYIMFLTAFLVLSIFIFCYKMFSNKST